MLLLGADSLRDVIAFPKVKDASCPMTGAPDFVDPAQLEVLKLGVAAGTEEKKREKRRPAMAVRQVAELAKLALSPEEEERMGRELEAVLDFAQALSSLDTQDVPMTAHVIPMENVFREDVPRAVHGPGSAAGLRSRPHPGMRGRAPNVRVRRVAPWKS